MLKPLPCEPSAPLTAAPALPDVPPVRVPDRRDPAAENRPREREEAWWWRPRWHGEALRPYSIGRDEVWRGLLQEESSGSWSSRMESSHLLRLLFVCSHDEPLLCELEPMELIERAEAWADENVPRVETAAALALVRRMLRQAAVVRARPRPADRRADKENVAIPACVASYTALVAEALPSLSLAEILWQVSLARGWSLIHAHWVASGIPTLWQDQSTSKTARWLQAWKLTRRADTIHVE